MTTLCRMNTKLRNQLAGDGVTTDEIGVLLGVWAHPDDEAYLSAGLMAVLRAAGQRVVVATATRGERGTQDPTNWTPKRLGAVREREMAASLAALGVEEHRWLGHCDGALHQVPVGYGAGQVAELIEQVRPDTVVTFGPDGLTGHTDHQAVSHWVSRAWDEAGRRTRLWHATLTPEFHRRWGSVTAATGFWMPGATPPACPAAELAFAVHCDENVLDRKLVALRAHASQTSHLVNQLGAERYRRWWASESFADAAARTNVDRDDVPAAA